MGLHLWEKQMYANIYNLLPQKPVISIILPILNITNNLITCLQSINNQNYSNIELIVITQVKNIKNMAQIMSDSDIAIINSGLTKYETVSVGLPCIVISNNDYHSELMNDFNKDDVFIHLGAVEKLENNQIVKAVELLAKDFKKR